jgi:hypothetical protein
MMSARKGVGNVGGSLTRSSGNYRAANNSIRWRCYGRLEISLNLRLVGVVAKESKSLVSEGANDT